MRASVAVNRMEAKVLMQANCAADLMGSLEHFMYRFQPLLTLYACVDLSRASICYRLHATCLLQSQPLNHSEGYLWFVLERAPLNASGTPMSIHRPCGRVLPKASLQVAVPWSTSSLKLQCAAPIPATHCSCSHPNKMKRHTSSLPCAIYRGRSRFVALLALQTLRTNQGLHRVRPEPCVATSRCMREVYNVLDRSVMLVL
jgi:hypothetical protein